MDKLDTKQRDLINKMFTQRLIIKLTQLGHAEDELETMQRVDLIATYAQALAEGKPIAASSVSIETDAARLQIERERLEFERDRLQLQTQQSERDAQLRQDELKLKQELDARDDQRRQDDLRLKQEQDAKEDQRRQVEMALERDKLALERERLELQRTSNERTLDTQAQRDAARDDREEQRRSTFAARIKVYTQSLQHVMPKMSNDPITLINFFDDIDGLFTRFEA